MYQEGGSKDSDPVEAVALWLRETTTPDGQIDHPALLQRIAQYIHNVRMGSQDEAGSRLHKAEAALQEMLAVDRARSSELEATRAAMQAREEDVAQAQTQLHDSERRVAQYKSTLEAAEARLQQMLGFQEQQETRIKEMESSSQESAGQRDAHASKLQEQLQDEQLNSDQWQRKCEAQEAALASTREALEEEQKAHVAAATELRDAAEAISKLEAKCAENQSSAQEAAILKEALAEWQEQFKKDKASWETTQREQQSAQAAAMEEAERRHARELGECQEREAQRGVEVAKLQVRLSNVQADKPQELIAQLRAELEARNLEFENERAAWKDSTDGVHEQLAKQTAELHRILKKVSKDSEQEQLKIAAQADQIEVHKSTIVTLRQEITRIQSLHQASKTKVGSLETDLQQAKALHSQLEQKVKDTVAQRDVDIKRAHEAVKQALAVHQQRTKEEMQQVLDAYRERAQTEIHQERAIHAAHRQTEQEQRQALEASAARLTAELEASTRQLGARPTFEDVERLRRELALAQQSSGDEMNEARRRISQLEGAVKTTAEERDHLQDTLTSELAALQSRLAEKAQEASSSQDETTRLNRELAVLQEQLRATQVPASNRVDAATSPAPSASTPSPSPRTSASPPSSPIRSMQSMVQARLQDSAVVGKQAGASSPGELEALKQELQKVLLWKENTESTFGTMSEQLSEAMAVNRELERHVLRMRDERDRAMSFPTPSRSNEKSPRSPSSRAGMPAEAFERFADHTALKQEQLPSHINGHAEAHANADADNLHASAAAMGSFGRDHELSALQQRHEALKRKYARQAMRQQALQQYMIQVQMADDAAPSVENTPFPFERARARYPPSQDSEPAVEPDIFRFQEPAALSEAESSARVQGAPALSERYTAGFDLAARHAQRVPPSSGGNTTRGTDDQALTLQGSETVRVSTNKSFDPSSAVSAAMAATRQHARDAQAPDTGESALRGQGLQERVLALLQEMQSHGGNSVSCQAPSPVSYLPQNEHRASGNGEFAPDLDTPTYLRPSPRLAAKHRRAPAGSPRISQTSYDSIDAIRAAAIAAGIPLAALSGITHEDDHADYQHQHQQVVSPIGKGGKQGRSFSTRAQTSRELVLHSQPKSRDPSPLPMHPQAARAGGNRPRSRQSLKGVPLTSPHTPHFNKRPGCSERRGCALHPSTGLSSPPGKPMSSKLGVSSKSGKELVKKFTTSGRIVTVSRPKGSKM